MPSPLPDLADEVYKALYFGCLRLATMGARTIIDTMLTEMIPDVSGFARQLAAAVEKGYLTNEEQETISAAIEAGHAATHRGFQPTAVQLNDVLDIVEHALNGRYVMKETSRRLDGYVPRRGTQ